MHCSSTARLELEHLANFTRSSQAGEVAEELAAQIRLQSAPSPFLKALLKLLLMLLPTSGRALEAR